MACPRSIHTTKHESSCFVSVVHKRLCHQLQMQQSFTSCVQTICRCLEPCTLTISCALPPVTEMGWMHLDGQLVPRLLSLAATYPESMQGDHLMWLYEWVPQPTLQEMHRGVQLQETWRQLPEHSWRQGISPCVHIYLYTQWRTVYNALTANMINSCTIK